MAATFNQHNLKKQRYVPAKKEPSTIVKLSNLGLDYPDGMYLRGKKSWIQQRVYHGDNFLLQAVNAYPSRDQMGWVKQQDYIKFLFHIGGKCTIVLDGFGEYELDRPQVLLTACPEDVIKVNRINGGVPQRLVSLCVRRDFFAQQMGLDVSALPEPLKTVFSPIKPRFALQGIELSAEMAVAVQTVLKGCDSISLSHLYYQSKALELMCLLIDQAERNNARSKYHSETPPPQMIERLHEARDFLSSHYATPMTLQEIAKHVGINKTSLTTGFHALFGLSVFDHINHQRMAHAYLLLSEGGYSIERIAELVGYGHASSFSTAFSRYYGCSPKAVHR